MAKKQKKTIFVSIATPEQSLFEGDVDFLMVPALDGDVGVMADHAPFLSPLREGRIDVTHNEHKQSLQVQGGFIAIADNNVRVLVS